MRSVNRLEQAIKKLYSAFHNDTLHPECARQCAVGNICNNNDSWKHFSDRHGSTNLNYVGMVNQKFGKTFFGYSPLELLHIEAIFLKGCGYSVPLNHKGIRPENPTNKDLLFNGLSNVITFLCELDGNPNVMDYSKLFDTKADSSHLKRTNFELEKV